MVQEGDILTDTQKGIEERPYVFRGRLFWERKQNYQSLDWGLCLVDLGSGRKASVVGVRWQRKMWG